MTGVTCQKNSLGELLLVCSLILLWDWLELRKGRRSSKAIRMDSKIHLGFIVLAVYLMHLSHSATSTVCLIVGAVIVGLSRTPFLSRRPQLLGVAALTLVLAFWVLDNTVGVKENIVSGLGRDMTYTGRTEVWDELLKLHTDPVFGVGFMSFWDDDQYQSKLPYWCAHASAHSGYMEEYLGGGWVGIFFVVVMLLGVGLRINNGLRWDGDYGVIRLAAFSCFVIHNFSESGIASMTILGFLFLLTGIGHAQTDFQINPTSEDLAVMDELQMSEIDGDRAFSL